MTYIILSFNTLQEVQLPGSGYTSGLSGCGLGVLLDAAIPQTKALAAEVRRYFPRLPAMPSRTLGAWRQGRIFWKIFWKIFQVEGMDQKLWIDHMTGGIPSIHQL